MYRWIRSAPLPTHTREQIRRTGRRLIPWLAALAGVIASGILGALIIQQIDPDDRIRIGNTAGSLSSMIEVGDERILIGAGPTRSHAADLIGRSSRPWDRTIDLLVIPGWDDFHATGAMGLLERREIAGIAVVGIPGEAPVWTLLEREAQETDIPLRYLSGIKSLKFGNESFLTMSPLENTDDSQVGSWIRLDHEGARFDFVDGASNEELGPVSPLISRNNDHVVIAMRSGLEIDLQTPLVRVQPEPFHRGEFAESPHDFHIDLPRNDHVTLNVEAGAIRAPIDMIEILD